MGYVYVSELVREKVGSRYVSAYQPPSLSHALHILIEPLYSLVGAVKGILLYCCYCYTAYRAILVKCHYLYISLMVF